MTNTPAPFLECGKVLNTHGVRGAVKAECWCDSPAVFCRIGEMFLTPDGRGALTVVSASPYKGMALVTFAGISSPEEALRLKGKTLFCRREAIPVAPGAMLLADMIGLPVRDARDGRLYGTLTDVTDAPASALYTVTTPDGKEVLLPAVPAFVSRVDPAEGVLVTPIPGFFDEGGDDDAL